MEEIGRSGRLAGMSAVLMPRTHAPAFRISAPALRRALVAGMRRVISRRELLNRINVFPVPDGDTGSNLAFTLHSVLQGSLSRRAANASALLRAVASDAIDGARGNSGAILAQFFCGASEALGDQRVLTQSSVGEAVRAGARLAREALAQPREGTIISVIQAFSDSLPSDEPKITRWFGRALDAARRALADTPKQLAVLRQAGVVDAGAQGFVDLLEGIEEFLQQGRVDAAAEHLEDTQEFAGSHWHDEADATRPWCSECLIDADALDRAGLRDALEQLGADSVVLAGGAQRLRLHAHVADPAVLFEIAGRFGRVHARKADDMRAQFRAASAAGKVAVVTDSAGDLPDELLEVLPLHRVPVRLSFGAEDFLDRVSMNPREFYARLAAGGELPKTSQPPPGDFRRQFELLLDHTDQVVYVGLSRALSGTLQSAEAAAERVDPTRIRVFDSGHGSCGQALLAIAAAEAAEQGASADEVLARLAALKPRTHTFALAREVSHAVRGGRIPRWAGVLAASFGLNAIAVIRADGKLHVGGALFGNRRIPERFAAYVQRKLPKGRRWRLLIGHAGAPEEGEALRLALLRRLDCTQSRLVEAGPAIGAHTGPGALVVGAQVAD
jgi:hypothetical protein